MAVLAIRFFGDPVLRERARPVEKFTDLHRRLVADMLDTMREAPGVGLAGPQVGVMDRIFVWEVEDEYGAVINPDIVEASQEMQTDEEGCLSIPGLVYPVERSLRCTIEGRDSDGLPLRIEAEGFKARVFQHETDHLNGVLFIDRLAPELRKEALRTLSGQALGLSVPQRGNAGSQDAL